MEGRRAVVGYYHTLRDIDCGTHNVFCKLQVAVVNAPVPVCKDPVDREKCCIHNIS